MNYKDGRTSDLRKYHSDWAKNNREKASKQAQRWRRKKKHFLIMRAGGECKICGYEYDGFNYAVFDFHHRDSTTKDSTMVNLGREKALEEIKKCDLLCANCHRMVHHV